MELQTIVRLEKPAFQIGYDTKMMLLGSCFVENIGSKLTSFRFKTEINPCGIAYNPLSVANGLELLLSKKVFIERDLLQNDGKWVSLNHHGRFSDVSLEVSLHKINTQLEKAVEYLKHTDVLIITWGTAWVYRYLGTNQVVANCHKFPASSFERFRLEVEEIKQVYTDLLRRLWEMHPKMKVLFTVSPIRHWKDGAHANQLSKSTLLLAIDHLVHQFEQVSYFPSYEIVMDELRDYRFYAEDMLHISQQGVDYIWEKFRNLYFENETINLMNRVEKLHKLLQHRSLSPDNESLRQLKEKAEQGLRLLGFSI